MRAARCLKGLTRDCGRFDDGEFEEAGFLRETAENGLAQAVYHVLRVQACYLLDEPALALSYARKGERWLPYLRTIFFQADHFFYSALALSSLHDGASPAEQDALLSELRGHHRRLELWARQSPATFGHKQDLVAAEIARLERRPDDRALSARSRARAAKGAATRRRSPTSGAPGASRRAGTTRPPRRTSAPRWRATPHGERSRRSGSSRSSAPPR